MAIDPAASGTVSAASPPPPRHGCDGSGGYRGGWYWWCFCCCCCCLYVLVEVVFYFVFHHYLVPRANRINTNTNDNAANNTNNTATTPSSSRSSRCYRDYPRTEQRHRLLLRILRRIERNAPAVDGVRTQNGGGGDRTRNSANDGGGDEAAEDRRAAVRAAVRNFVLQWFETTAPPAATSAGDAVGPKGRRPPPPPPRMMESTTSEYSSSGSSSSQCSSTSSQCSSSSGKSNRNVDPSRSSEGERGGGEDDDVTEYSSSSGGSGSGSSIDGGDGEDGGSGPFADSATTWTVEGLGRDAMDRFLAWAFFEKEADALSEPERRELRVCYAAIRKHNGLVFPSARGPSRRLRRYRPRRLSLERVNPIHRPFLVYVVLFILKWFVTHIILRFGWGFRRVVSPSTGLAAWYLPPRPRCKDNSNNSSSSSSSSNGDGSETDDGDADTGENDRNDGTDNDTNDSTDPLLFFHGIAPAGLTFYVPMVLSLVYGTSRRGRRRACYLFENPNVSSCSIDFTALTERETVRGVREILDVTASATPSSKKDREERFALVGHSFGSCPLTWLFCDPRFRSKISQLVLLDPVTVLLSEPDVMNNFLYNTDGGLSKIRAVASSELFTEYYLRRHFRWYNSELWLEDVSRLQRQQQQQQQQQTEPIRFIIALSGKDQIVNSPKVKQAVTDVLLQPQPNRKPNSNHNISHVDDNVNDNSNSNAVHGNHHQYTRLIYWERSQHADCVTSPSKWRQLAAAMTDPTTANHPPRTPPPPRARPCPWKEEDVVDNNNKKKDQ